MRGMRRIGRCSGRMNGSLHLHNSGRSSSDSGSSSSRSSSSSSSSSSSGSSSNNSEVGLPPPTVATMQRANGS